MKSRRILTLAMAAALILSSFATSVAASGVIHRDEWRQTHLSGQDKARLEMEEKANETEAPETDAEGEIIPEPSEITVPLSIADPLPEKNMLIGSDFNEISCVGDWQANTQAVNWIWDENGGYIKLSGIVQNYRGFNYVPAKRPDAGKYKVSGYIRCAVPGEITGLRMFMYWGANGEQHLISLYPTSDEWLKFETYVELTSKLTRIHICGESHPVFTQAYCIDNLAIEPVDEIPEGIPTVFGTPCSVADVEAATLASKPKYDKYDKAAEDAAGYKIQGIMVNQDADGVFSSLIGASEDQIIDFARSFRDTHITDYVLSLNNTLASFPSESWYDVIDKYYEKEENGIAVDYTSRYAGPYHMFEVLESDHFGLMNEGFREVGINTWLSMRVNDVHDHNATLTSSLLSDFHWQHPEVYRVHHPSTQRSYWNNGYDYTHRIIQERLLSLFNDALNRYDVYGIEIDFHRDMYLWYIGGEYNGLDIFNNLMRELRDLVAVFEEKYGHEIKIGVRVDANIETNYTFGLDVLTWASEDIVDMVCVSNEFDTTNNNTPIRLWKSLLAPYDIELAGCIEQYVKSTKIGSKGENDFESYNAAAASYLSQGADKVYLYNYFLGCKEYITDEDRITTDDNTLSVSAIKQYHNIFTTIGSYDKLMTKTRKMITTYPTTFMPWQNMQAQLPQTAFPGNVVTVVQYVGDIPEGAKVTLKFALPSAAYSKNPPDLLVNGTACTYEKIEYSSMGVTPNPLFCYDVPAEAHTSGNFYIEILPKDFIDVSYVEVYVEPAK